MSPVYCRPSMMAAAVLMAFPTVLPAQTSAPSTSPVPSSDPGSDTSASLHPGSDVASAPPSMASSPSANNPSAAPPDTADMADLATTHGQKLPQKLPDDTRQAIGPLKQSKNFDAAPVQPVHLKEHETDIALLEKTSPSTRDTDLQKWASENMPMLRLQLAQAQVLHPDGMGKNRRSTQDRSGSSGAANAG